MSYNVNRNKIFVFILCSLFISSVYQACGERYDGLKDLSSQDQFSNSDFSLLVLDKINGTFRSLPINNTKITIGTVYKVLVSDKKGRPFTGKIDWLLDSIPSNACAITASANNSLEADLSCNKESNVSLNIKVHPSNDPNAKVSIIDYTLSTFSELALKAEGQTLYQMHCNACHSSTSPNYKKDRTTDQIAEAIFNTNIPMMNNLASLKLLSPTELRAIAQSLVTINASDTQKPDVAITNPTNNKIVTGTIQVDITATDETELQKVSLEIGLGIKVSPDQINPPFVYTLDTTTLTKGEHFLKAIATDSSGNTNSASIKIVVDNTIPPPVDTTLPVVGFLQPTDGAKVNADFTARVNAIDNIAVTSVQFFLDNNTLGAADTAAPFEYIVPIASLATGSNHQLKAEARDAAGNKASTSITFIVDKTLPTVAISEPASGATISGVTIVKITATDTQGVETTYIDVDGTMINLKDKTTPYEIALDTNGLTNGSHTLSAYAQDMAGNIGKKSIPITISNSDPYNVPEAILAADYPANADNIAAGESLFVTNCSICHNSTAKRDRSYSVYRSVIGPHSTKDEMKTIDLVSADVYKIYLYLTNAVGGGSSSSLEQSQPLIGTRTYVASIFRTIFVSNAGNLADDTTIKNKISSLILTQAGPMGGTCQKNDITATDSTCATKITETSQGPMLPNANSLRRGYITRACEETLSLDQSVTSALQKVGLTSNSDLNAANLALVFDLFNPGTPISTAVQTNLMKVVNSTSLASNLDKWRFILYGLCRSAGAEVL